jgi:hypothetical protein
MIQICMKLVQYSAGRASINGTHLRPLSVSSAKLLCCTISKTEAQNILAGAVTEMIISQRLYQALPECRGHASQWLACCVAGSSSRPCWHLVFSATQPTCHRARQVLAGPSYCPVAEARNNNSYFLAVHYFQEAQGCENCYICVLVMHPVTCILCSSSSVPLSWAPRDFCNLARLSQSLMLPTSPV